MILLALLLAQPVAGAEPASTAAPAAGASQATVVAEPSEASPTAPAPAPLTITANTIIELEFVEAASSKTNKSGDLVPLQVAEEVRGIHNELLIPRGSKAFAEVIQASKGGMGGKAGELTIAARYVQLGPQQVRLKRLTYGRTAGKDSSTALNTAAVASSAVALASLFVTGGNVNIPAGTRASAVVIADTTLTNESSTDLSPKKEGE